MKRIAVVLFALTMLSVTIAWAGSTPQATIVPQDASALATPAFQSVATQLATVEVEPFQEPTFLATAGMSYACEEANACTFDRDCDPPMPCINPTGLACAGTCC